MKIYTIQRKQWVPRPLLEIFDFFSKPENLERLTPSFLRFQITRTPPRMEAGARIEYRIQIHGMPVRWLTDIETWDPPREFIDVQKRGPYRLWHHTHKFWEGDGGTWIEDTVRFALPFGVLGRVVHAVSVARDVRQIFEYREKVIRELFP